MCQSKGIKCVLEALFLDHRSGICHHVRSSCSVMMSRLCSFYKPFVKFVSDHTIETILSHASGECGLESAVVVFPPDSSNIHGSLFLKHS